MNFNIKFLLLNLALLTASAFGMEAPHKPKEVAESYNDFKNKISFEQLLQHYSVNPELKQLIDENFPAFGLEGSMQEFSWLPGYIIKKNIDRLWGALFIKECATAYNLEISCPDKLIYKAKSGKYYVVVKKIKSDHYLQYPCKAMQQLYKICKITNYIDIHHLNTLIGENNVVYIIDTEQKSFFAGPDFNFIIVFQCLSDCRQTDDDGELWLESKYKKLLAKQETVIIPFGKSGFACTRPPIFKQNQANCTII